MGQLINGMIGDKIKAKYMLSCGLFFAGIMNLVFSRVANIAGASLLAYGLSGFCLAMIYGPMTKTVAENTDPILAPRCSVGYTFASFFGSPLAVMGSNGAASMLWSRYCPSLRDTVMVSSATGFLDFLSYIAAAISSSVFANAVSDIGWGNLILVWLGLALCGIIVSIPKKAKKIL